jgi:hypothetical protein
MFLGVTLKLGQRVYFFEGQKKPNCLVQQSSALGISTASPTLGQRATALAWGFDGRFSNRPSSLTRRTSLSSVGIAIASMYPPSL